MQSSACGTACRPFNSTQEPCISGSDERTGTSQREREGWKEGGEEVCGRERKQGEGRGWWGGRWSGKDKEEGACGESGKKRQRRKEGGRT